MTAPPQVGRFKGTDWDECNEFILSVRARAHWEGKQRDTAWIADFAALSFSHEALLWHCRLPLDVRRDWFKLEGRAAGEVGPWGRSGTKPPSHDKSTHPRGGVIKVVTDHSDSPCYVGLNARLGNATLTDKVEDALYVKCRVLSQNVNVFECSDFRSYAWLGVQWSSEPYEMRDGATEFAELVLVDPTRFKTSWDEGREFQPFAYTLSTDNQLAPYWRKDNDLEATAFHVFVGDSSWLSLTPSPAAFSESHPTAKKAVEAIYSTDGAESLTILTDLKNVVPFKGDGSWEECNAFVKAIRTAAWKEGKQCDLAWMADIAARKEVQGNWSKLQVALIKRWAPEDEDDEAKTEPTPAAAPQVSGDNRPLEGLIKVVVKSSSSSFILASDLVSSIVASPSIGMTLFNYARLSAVNLETLVTAWGRTSPYRIVIGALSASGKLDLRWHHDTSSIALQPFVSVDHLSLYLAVDSPAYAMQYPDEEKAERFIEVTN
ncbi:hypothetical protein FRB90_002061 [Tulasnella sp. 427]|nr:hypothetical protein FRB90_002061 [Tulasnella sp. 427]